MGSNEISETIVRVTKKRTMYIPKKIADELGIREGDLLELRVDDGKLIARVIPDPFNLALHCPKFASISFEDLEKGSEEMQEEIFRESSS